jgi:hypothetical protein
MGAGAQNRSHPNLIYACLTPLRADPIRRAQMAPIVGSPAWLQASGGTVAVAEQESAGAT